MAITSSTAPAVETTTSNAAADTAMARFETQTSRYGSLTMTIGLLLSLTGPAYLVFFGDLDISASMVWIAFLAVAGTFRCLVVH